MTSEVQEFVLATSVVVFASADAVDGMLVGNWFRAGIGIALLVSVALDVVFDLIRRTLTSSRGRRRAIWLLTSLTTPRARRIGVGLLVLSFAIDLIQLGVAAAGRDLGGCVFYAVKGPALAGVLYGWVTLPLSY